MLPVLRIERHIRPDRVPLALRVDDACLTPVAERVVDVGAFVGAGIVSIKARRRRIVAQYGVVVERHVYLLNDLVQEHVLVCCPRPNAITVEIVA